MATLYKNFRKADVKNAPPGYAANAWIVPLSYIQTFADVVGTAAIGDKFTIDDSHVFVTDKGAISCYCVPKTIEGDGEMVGELLARRMGWKPKIIIPGDDPVKQEIVDNLLNEDFMLFVQDASCGSSQFIQFGCDCDPCNVEAGSFKSGNAGTGRKQTEMTLLTYCKYFYNGILQELPDE